MEGVEKNRIMEEGVGNRIMEGVEMNRIMDGVVRNMIMEGVGEIRSWRGDMIMEGGGGGE